MMATTQDDEKSRYKLAQLSYAITQYPKHSYKCIVNDLLKEDFNINYKIIRNRDLEFFNICENHDRTEVCTVLHMLASTTFNIDIFNSLLERGADFTIKNENGQTALHLLIERYRSYVDRNNDVVPFINSILSTHVKLENSINPRDDNGISHLHAASIVNHFEAIEWFLDNGVSIDEAVKIEAPKFAGYTPLHFAAYYGRNEAAQVLIGRGANVNAKDASGMSVIDLLVGRLRLFKLYEFSKHHFYVKGSRIADEVTLTDIEEIVKLLLKKPCLSAIGLSTVQVAFTLKDLSIAESLLNQVDINYAVPMESPIDPGYTAAHFAALNSIDAVKMLAMREANLSIEDANGLTPLDICVEKYSVQDIHDILSCIENWKYICLSDGKTKLMDLVLSMRDLDQFRLFLENDIQDLVVPNDSPLWPGSTILHLAVILSSKIEGDYKKPYDESIVKECLERGLDIGPKNSKGQTPLHIAFRLGKVNIARALIQHLCGLDKVMSLVDEDNLSYLHIACAMENGVLVEKLLSNSESNVVYKGKRILVENSYPFPFIIEPGWTPLHVAVDRKSRVTAETLLRHGANLHAADIYGLTPIHWLLKVYNDSFNDLYIGCALFSWLLKNPEDHVVGDLGLSYLHIACIYMHVQAVEKLLDLGSNVNAIINFEKSSWYSSRHFSVKPLTFLVNYSMFTPLHCATRNPKPALIDALLRRGADVFVKFSNQRESFYLLEKIDIARIFVYVASMQNLLGFTKLHAACFAKNDEAIRRALNDGVDANVQIHADSVIFPGYTPLHLLMTVVQSKDYRHSTPPPNIKLTISRMINLLLNHVADVLIRNTEGDTPVHVFCKYRRYFTDRDLCKKLLLKAHRNFRVNSVNTEGLSHFHLACFFHVVEVVQKFLKYTSVDINRPIDCFAKEFPGCTPLHLTLSHDMTGPNDDWTKLMLTITLLLKNGANVAFRDVHGDTPLHKKAALIPAGISTLELLISYGGDIKSENVKGETPMEKWSFTNCDDYARIFQKSGYQMNYWNRLTGEGYIAKLFLSQSQDIAQSSEFRKWIQSSDVTAVDEMGRTVIHNTVAILRNPRSGRVENYIYVIESFMNLGIDIDHQDKLGKTALHYAAQMGNLLGIKALLECGIDINIVDHDGKPAYTYSTDYNVLHGVAVNLRGHVQTLVHLRIEVSECNRNLANYVEERWQTPIKFLDTKVSSTILNQIEVAKTLNVGINSLTLFHFLSETDAISSYPFLPKSTQSLIDRFFDTINFEELKDLTGIIKLQFRKMKARSAMIDSALTALRILLGFSFPGLCEEISKCLSNSDLKNVISSLNMETL